MSVIERNDYGAIGVNKSVIEKMIIEELLGMNDSVLLCNKKGKLIKTKVSPKINPGSYDALEVNDKRGEVSIKTYIAVKHGKNISEIADSIFEKVERVFHILKLARPKTINVKVKGIMSDELVKRNIEVIRRND